MNMSKNIKYNNPDNQQIKELLSGIKLEAGDNLKYRIMHQIEAEKALSRKAKSGFSRSAIRSFFSVFGIMYAVITIIGLGIYLSAGKSALGSSAFYIPVLLVIFICGLYWMITSLDDRLREKRKKRE